LAFREILEAFIDNPSIGIPSRKVRTAEKKEQRKAELKKVSCLWKWVIKKLTPSLWETVGHEKEVDGLYSLIFSAFSDLIALRQKAQDPASFAAKVINTIVPWKETQDFLEEIDTWVEASGQWSSFSRGSDVQLMSLQGAKGLEAKVVCVIGLEEGILPRSDSSEKDLAEQSRLIFVSMTRASEELHLFHARKRSGSLIFRSPYKKGGPPDIQKSRFLDFIPNEHREARYHKA
jgi:superfamily I DNA/RNA helicase